MNRFLALLLLAAAPVAHAECDLADQGVFTNPALNGEFNAAEVTVRHASKDMMVFEVNIPCGSKVIPTTLYLSCSTVHGNYENLLVQEAGSSQCSLGSNPTISIIRDRLTIFTEIRTPGFNGRYEFTRQAP